MSARLAAASCFLACCIAGCSSDGGDDAAPADIGPDIVVTTDVPADSSTADSSTADIGADDVTADASEGPPLEWTIDPNVPPTAVAANKLTRFSGYQDAETGHHIYFCGEKGVFRIRDSAGTWRDVDLTTSDRINFCHARSDSQLAAVGDGGKVWKWSGAGWSGQDLVQTGANLSGVWVSSPETLRVVGVAGTIYRLDNQLWTDESLAGESGTVEAIWGAEDGSLFATGDDLLLRYDGSTWVREDLPEGQPFSGRAIWGADADNVWAVGGPGKVARRSASGEWSLEDAQWFATAFVSVWGASTTDVWAFAIKGMVRRYDGTTWEPVEMVTPKKTPEGAFWPGERRVPNQSTLDYVGAYGVDEREFYVFTSDGRLITYGDDYLL